MEVGWPGLEWRQAGLTWNGGRPAWFGMEVGRLGLEWRQGRQGTLCELLLLNCTVWILQSCNIITSSEQVERPKLSSSTLKWSMQEQSSWILTPLLLQKDCKICIHKQPASSKASLVLWSHVACSTHRKQAPLNTWQRSTGHHSSQELLYPPAFITLPWNPRCAEGRGEVGVALKPRNKVIELPPSAHKTTTANTSNAAYSSYPFRMHTSFFDICTCSTQY